MFGFRHPRISIALLLALFSGAGYLVGTSAQRTQGPERAVTPSQEKANAAPAETATFDLRADLAWTPDYYVELPPGCVLVHGGLNHVVDQGGVPILPPDIVSGDFAPSSFDRALLTADRPNPCSAESLQPLMDGFF